MALLAQVRAARQDAALQAVPVVLVSAASDADTLAAAGRRGADGYIVKPFAAGQVRAQLARLAPQDYALAVETVNCRRLVKGYSDTHVRGGGKYRQLIAAAAQLVGRPDAADTLRALRDTALANEKCGPMERQLADKLAA
ncbi:hypothetical protein G6F50_017007 [Rhizopus delemar]|uniref:Response regulatory domain-containing protein n=1 Tax=Rhizopus delemar TaxID=936053 RepID=A0A9P6XRC8_9FUNG|nr:hypothetical protein G6F50_017007 [Rhizopus delemar]